MFYVGLDIHTKWITTCVLDCDGKLHHRCQFRQVDQLVTFLERLPERFEACFEASCGYGWCYDLLKPLASRVVVAHPGLLRLIFRSRQKNDRSDAEKLAKLLYLGEVPTVHVPTANVRAWRELITFRKKLIEKRTKAKNGIRALLRSLGIQAPNHPGLWTKQGLTWLQQLEFQQSMHTTKRNLLVAEILMFTEQIRNVEQQLQQDSKSSVEVWQLRSIPGVGLRTAEAVVAFIDDPHRFASSKQVGAYFGVVPTQDQSGDKNRLGHITRQGAASVRWLLAEATWQAIRRSPTVRAYFERIQRDDPARKKIAVTATAHYLVRVMWAMLKHGSMWSENESHQAA
jgi:transposase